MNQLSNTLERTPSAAPLYKTSDWHTIVGDPATLVMLTALRSKQIQSLDSFLDKVPFDLRKLALSIVSHLETRCDLTVVDGTVTLLNRDFFEVYDFNTLPKFLPNLNMDATRSVIKKAGAGKPANSFRFIAIPRNQKNIKKVKEATDKFYADLAAISATDLGDSDDNLTIQYVSVINTEITMEDLV